MSCGGRWNRRLNGVSRSVYVQTPRVLTGCGVDSTIHALTAIVDTPEEAAALELPPLLIRRPLEAFLDAHGLGSGPLDAEPIGEGHSNVT